MDEGRRLFAIKQHHPLVLAAGHQENGRGRGLRRRWYDQPDSSLLFTIALPSPTLTFPIHQVPLRAGLGVLRFIKSHISEHEIRIKWPNDVLIDGMKVCGILCESDSDGVYIGIGINCREASVPIRESVHPPTYLSRYLTGLHAPLDLLEGVLESIKHVFADDRWRLEVEASLHRRGDQVLFHPGQVSGPSEGVSGVLEGIDEYGGIVIRDEYSGIRNTWYAGEIVHTVTEV
jgi:BirA family biotin operon repressor/biotin-[acetyl-CoA-carboxylase] ligase